MDAVTAVSGSGPAYVYLFIEALADGGVKAGLPRPVALKLAAQTVKGSAMMVSETGVHPGELKDRVCSPGGTTIEAVATLEEKGFRGAVIAAVDACREKSERMSK
jgi:pyrroline-5-carboxylate reductase